MATPTWIRRILQARGIPFEELHHREAFTAQDVAHREHVSGHRVAKVVVVMVDGRPVELVLPASRQVDLDQVRTITHAHDVRLASEIEMQRDFTDCELGAIPPLPHWKYIDVIMDESMKVEGEIVFQAGTHADAVRLKFRDWYNMANPTVASFTKPN